MIFDQARVCALIIKQLRSSSVRCMAIIFGIVHLHVHVEQTELTHSLIKLATLDAHVHGDTVHPISDKIIHGL